MTERFAISTEQEAPVETLGAFADLAEIAFNIGLELNSHEVEPNPYLLMVAFYATIGKVAEDMIDIAVAIENDSLIDDKLKNIQANLHHALGFLMMVNYKLGAYPHGNTNAETP